MAGEVQIVLPSTPTTAYFVVKNSVGQFWNTSGTPAFEAYNAAHWTDYDVALSQHGSSQEYSGAFPSAIPTGVYQWRAYAQSGGSPAVGDAFLGGVDEFVWPVAAPQNSALFWAGALANTGTAQAGAAGTITLAAGASSVDDFYKNAVVVLTSGTGAGQNRRITGYVGSTKVATISGDRNWATNPDSTSTYVILGDIP